MKSSRSSTLVPRASRKVARGVFAAFAGFGSLTLLTGAASLAGCKDAPKSDPAPAASASASASAPPAEASAPESKNPYSPERIRQIVNPSGYPPYAGPTGSVEGTISVRGGDPPKAEADFSRCPDAAATYGTRYRIGAPSADGHALADAIVAVTGYDAYVPAKGDSVGVSFEGCAYDRRTILLTYGQRIEILNRSKRQMITPDIEGMPLISLRIAAPQSIAPVKLYPPQVGRFRLIDRGVLTYVSEDVYVLLQPLHATTDLKGYYRIDGIPVGKATVNAAHPAFGGDAAKEIQISPNVVQRVDLVLTPADADAGARPPAKADAGKPKPAPLR